MDIAARLDQHGEMFVDVRERLSKIETRLDHIDSNMATRADLAEVSATIVKWVVGMIFGTAVAALTVMTFVLNNAVPKAPPAPPTPIVIQVPACK